MSYKYKIVADNPVGFWDLAYQTSTSSVNFDITSASNNASMSWNSTFSVPPIIPNSGSTLKFSFGTSSVQILNKYDAFNVNALNKTFSMEFWLSFNNSYMGALKNNQLNVINILNNATGSTIGRIYYDYNSHTMRFSINGSGNQDAFYYIKNIYKPLHIIASYDGQTSIIVNAEKGTNGIMNDYSLIKSASLNTNVKYIIDGSSIQLNSASPSFLVSNLAFYNYKMDKAKILNHMALANLDDYPNQSSRLNNSIDFFDIKSNSDYYSFYKYMNGRQLGDFKTIYNLENNAQGVGTKLINNLKYSNVAQQAYSINSSSGITWSSSSNFLFFSDMGKFINKNFTVYATISSSVGASNQFLLSMTNINNNGTIFLQKNPPSASGYYLYFYNESSKVMSLLASVNYANTQAAGKDVVMFSFDSQNVYLYASNSFVSNALPSFVSTNGIYPSNNSRLMIGTNSIGNSACATQGTTFYSNVGVYDYSTTTAATASSIFNNNYMLLFPLTSDLSVNQYGYVIYEMQTGFFKSKNYGSYINWNGSSNIKSEVSYDNGYNWNPVYQDNYINGYNVSVPQEKTLLRFTFNQNFSASQQNLRLNNFEFALMRNVNFISDMGRWQMVFNTSSVLYTHSIRTTNNKIISRPKNLGLTFKNDTSGYVHGYSTVMGSGSAYGLDMWMRLDTASSNRTIYFLNSSSYSLFYNPANNALQFASAGQMFVYINGASVANNTFILSQNETYHIGISHGFPVSGSINLNGGVHNSGSTNANATYGALSIWSSSPLQTDMQSRYSLYTSNNIQVASATDTSVFLRQPGYYDAASVFYIG